MAYTYLNFLRQSSSSLLTTIKTSFTAQLATNSYNNDHHPMVRRALSLPSGVADSGKAKKL